MDREKGRQTDTREREDRSDKQTDKRSSIKRKGDRQRR